MGFQYCNDATTARQEEQQQDKQQQTEEEEEQQDKEQQQPEAEEEQQDKEQQLEEEEQQQGKQQQQPEGEEEQQDKEQHTEEGEQHGKQQQQPEEEEQQDKQQTEEKEALLLLAMETKAVVLRMVKEWGVTEWTWQERALNYLSEQQKAAGQEEAEAIVDLEELAIGMAHQHDCTGCPSDDGGAFIEKLEKFSGEENIASGCTLSSHVANGEMLSNR